MDNGLPQTSTPRRAYDYAFLDIPDREALDILGTVPGRWGRMPPLCRAVVVECGRFLQERARLGRPPLDTGRPVGLIGGTSWGSLAPDRDFAATLLQGSSLASPAIFGYTLANIPLAEAANQYHLTGPVYAVLDTVSPFAAAVREAERLLRLLPGPSSILACAFDDDPGRQWEHRLSLTFTLVETNA